MTAQRASDSAGQHKALKPNDLSNPQHAAAGKTANADAKPNARSGFKIPPTNKDSRKLFVGGLPSNVTDEEFREFFSQYGAVVDSVVMFDRDTGRSRGFGFVTFEDEAVSRGLVSEGVNEKGTAFGHVTLRDKVCEIKAAEPKESPGLGNNRGGRSRGGHPGSNFRGKQQARNFHLQDAPPMHIVEPTAMPVAAQSMYMTPYQLSYPGYNMPFDETTGSVGPVPAMFPGPMPPPGAGVQGMYYYPSTGAPTPMYMGAPFYNSYYAPYPEQAVEVNPAMLPTGAYQPIALDAPPAAGNYPVADSTHMESMPPQQQQHPAAGFTVFPVVMGPPAPAKAVVHDAAPVYEKDGAEAKGTNREGQKTVQA